MNIAVLNNLRDKAINAITNLDTLQLADQIDRVVKKNGGGTLHTVAVGKSYLVAKKCSDTMNLLGNPSCAYTPTDLTHGGIGAVGRWSSLLCISNSGATKEMIELIQVIKDNKDLENISLFSITPNCNTPIAQLCDENIETGYILEGCPVDLVPTTSILVQNLICDMLAYSLEYEQMDTDDDDRFMRDIILGNHPLGQLKERV